MTSVLNTKESEATVEIKIMIKIKISATGSGPVNTAPIQSNATSAWLEAWAAATEPRADANADANADAALHDWMRRAFCQGNEEEEEEEEETPCPWWDAWVALATWRARGAPGAEGANPAPVFVVDALCGVPPPSQDVLRQTVRANDPDPVVPRAPRPPTVTAMTGRKRKRKRTVLPEVAAQRKAARREKDRIRSKNRRDRLRRERERVR